MPGPGHWSKRNKKQSNNEGGSKPKGTQTRPRLRQAEANKKRQAENKRSANRF